MAANSRNISVLLRTADATHPIFRLQSPADPASDSSKRRNFPNRAYGTQRSEARNHYADRQRVSEKAGHRGLRPDQREQRQTGQGCPYDRKCLLHDLHSHYPLLLRNRTVRAGHRLYHRRKDFLLFAERFSPDIDDIADSLQQHILMAKQMRILGVSVGVSGPFDLCNDRFYYTGDPSQSKIDLNDFFSHLVPYPVYLGKSSDHAAYWLYGGELTRDMQQQTMLVAPLSGTLDVSIMSNGRLFHNTYSGPSFVDYLYVRDLHGSPSLPRRCCRWTGSSAMHKNCLRHTRILRFAPCHRSVTAISFVLTRNLTSGAASL